MRRIWIAAGVVAVLVVAAWVVPGRALRKGPVRIGAILCLTGPIAPYGQSAKCGVDLAVSEINARGGVGGRRLEVITEDCQSDAKVANSAARKLIFQDKVPAVVGFVGSSLLLATAPLFDGNRVVLVSPGASSPAISKAGDYIFRTRASGDAEARALADYAVKTAGYKRLAVLYVNNDFGKSWLETFGRRAALLGRTVGCKEAFPQGATDMRAQLLKINASTPDCLLVLAYLNEIAVALKQSRELGLRAQILTTVGVEDEKIFQLVGERANGLVYSAVDYDPRTNSASERFDAAFRAKYGRGSDMFAANAYNAVDLLAGAIAKVGSNGDRIQKYLLAVKGYEAVGGTLGFDKNGDVVQPVIIKTIREYKFVRLAR